MLGGAFRGPGMPCVKHRLDFREPLLARGGPQHMLSHGRPHKAWTERKDVDAILPCRGRKVRDENEHPCLTATIARFIGRWGSPWPCGYTEETRHIDDSTTATGQHPRQDGMRTEQRPAQIHGDIVPPVLRVDFPEGTKGTEASRIVHQQIHRAALALRFCDQVLHSTGVRHVCWHSDRPSPLCVYGSHRGG